MFNINVKRHGGACDVHAKQGVMLLRYGHAITYASISSHFMSCFMHITCKAGSVPPSLSACVIARLCLQHLNPTLPIGSAAANPSEYACLYAGMLKA